MLGGFIHASTARVPEACGGSSFPPPSLLPLPRGALHDLVHTEDGFGGFGGGDEDVALQLQRLEDAEFLHVPDAPLVHVCGGADGEGIAGEWRYDSGKGRRGGNKGSKRDGSEQREESKG